MAVAPITVNDETSTNVEGPAITSTCTSGWSCVWAGENYTHYLASHNGTWNDFHHATCYMFGISGPCDMNDRMRSVANGGTSSSLRACYYLHNSRRNLLFRINNRRQGGQWRDPYLKNGVSGYPGDFEDEVSSANFCRN